MNLSYVHAILIVFCFIIQIKSISDQKDKAYLLKQSMKDSQRQQIRSLTLSNDTLTLIVTYDYSFRHYEYSEISKSYQYKYPVIDTRLGIYSSTLSINKSILAVCGLDHNARIYRYNQTKYILNQTIIDAINQTRIIRISQDGQILIVGGLDNMVRIYKYNSIKSNYQRTGILNNATDWILAAALSKNKQLLITGGVDQIIRFYTINNISSYQLNYNISITGTIWSIVFSNDQQLLIVGSSDCITRIYKKQQNTTTYKLVQQIKDLQNQWIHSVSISKDKQILVTGSNKLTTVYRFNSNNNQYLKQQVLNDSQPQYGLRIWGTAVSGDGNMIITGGDDGTVRVYRYQSCSDGSHIQDTTCVQDPSNTWLILILVISALSGIVLVGFGVFKLIKNCKKQKQDSLLNSDAERI